LAKNGKTPKSSFNVAPNKLPSSREAPDAAKQPKTVYADDAMQMTPTWRISKLQMAPPWGWHEIVSGDALSICEKLASYEEKTWNEIIVKSSYWNHRMECRNLCKEARERLAELNLDDLEFLVSLRLSSTERVWGFLEHNVLNLLWWDPEHKVYPVEKKNT
jgi:hypothetical protein